MKYVILQTDSDPPRKFPIIFTDNLVHAAMSATAARFLRLTLNVDVEPVSAGKMQMRDGRVACYGESETLGLTSEPDDVIVISKFLKGEACIDQPTKAKDDMEEG